jgi:predicted RNA-binding protein with PUA-like domain
MNYLLKTEPSEYSFADLQRDKRTVWDGVTNPVALKHLREMKKGDHLVIYHTGDEKRAVGTALVESVDTSEPKRPVVRLNASSPLKSQMTLAEIKSNPAFAESPLVKQGRLSVVPLTEKQYGILAGK